MGLRTRASILEHTGHLVSILVDAPAFGRSSHEELTQGMGITLPPAQSGLGLVDTGSRRTFVTEVWADALQLFGGRPLKYRTVESRGTGPIPPFVTRERFGEVSIDGSPKIQLMMGTMKHEADLGFQVLIGRDALAHFQLFYDGKLGQAVLKYVG